eukprot:4342575-Pyramimonas_sp.AAC.1
MGGGSSPRGRPSSTSGSIEGRTQRHTAGPIRDGRAGSGFSGFQHTQFPGPDADNTSRLGSWYLPSSTATATAKSPDA